MDYAPELADNLVLKVGGGLPANSVVEVGGTRGGAALEHGPSCTGLYGSRRARLGSGTSGSNPLCSTGESANSRSL